jgi:hypothetical protein
VCACAIATPSVTMNAMAIAATAHLRTIISGLHRSLRKATTCTLAKHHSDLSWRFVVRLVHAPTG